jgi:hypothetical protein
MRQYLQSNLQWNDFLEEIMAANFSPSVRPENVLNVTNIGQPEDDKEEDEKESKYMVSLFDEAVINPKYSLALLKDVFYSNIRINENTFINMCDVFEVYRIEFDFVSKKQDTQQIFLGGSFVQKTQTIKLYVNNNIIHDYEEFLTLDDLWLEFSLFLGHELIHKFQFYKRDSLHKDYDNTSKKRYLSQKDEIMSFAWNCIDLFFIRGFSKNKILRLLSNQNYDDMEDSKDILHNYFLMLYKTTFKNTEDEKYLKMFYKYCYLYLDKFFKGIK